MRTLLTMMLILLPGLSFAQTSCRSVEHPDHFEAVCLGDEKATPAVETPSVTAVQNRDQQQTASQQMQVPVTSQVAPPAQPQSAAPTAQPPQPSQTQASPAAEVVHRQGRQQYKKGMDDAKAARQRLIEELQQSQPAP